jgi:hypothetical protein
MVRSLFCWTAESNSNPLRQPTLAVDLASFNDPALEGTDFDGHA